MERKDADFEDLKRFCIEPRTYSKQFCGVYKARLAALKATIIPKSKEKWSNHKVMRIVDLKNDRDETCVLVGTLYKHQELKPSILREISEELQLVPQPLRTNYCSANDAIFLEDNVSRLKLIGNVPYESTVTGLVCAVLGKNLQNGSFEVEDFCFPGSRFRPTTRLPPSSAKDHGKAVLLLSGLDFVNQPDNLGFDLLSDWISGMVGDEKDQERAASVVRVIIAGNSVKGTVETFDRKGYFNSKNKDSMIANEMHYATYRFDCFLESIARSCGVIVMPGEFDPSCHAIPQHALHSQILPLSSRTGNTYRATNPWIGKIGSRLIASSSGQTIADIMKVANFDYSPIEWMEKTLEWLHYAPTAPDTLAEYPYEKTDPFVMKEYPSIYFVGNMDKFESKIIESIDLDGQLVRLITVPKFAETHTAVLVDLESLDTQSISFGA